MVLLVQSRIQGPINGIVFKAFSPTQKKLSSEVQGQANVIIAFFDKDGISHCEFVPDGQTANTTLYEEVLKWLLARIRRVSPKFHMTGH